MLVEFSIVPLDKGIHLSEYIAQVLELVEKSGLDYHLHAMGTLVEGEWDEVLPLIKECHMRIRKISARVLTTIKIDDREGATGRIQGKRAAVEKTLGRKLK